MITLKQPIDSDDFDNSDDASQVWMRRRMTQQRVSTLATIGRHVILSIF